LYDFEISNNIITNNGGYGIYSAFHNERVNITNNVIEYNGENGIVMVSFEQSNVYGNTITKNEGGIWLWTSYNNSIWNNNISFNGGPYSSNYLNHAIFFHGNSNFNVVENNTIIDNKYQEFYFRESSNNTIRNNMIIESSKKYYLYNGECIGNLFENNTIFYDTYELNDKFEYADRLEQGFYTDLVAVNEDWYEIFLQQGELCEVYLNYSPNYDPLDLELYNSSNSLINYSDTGTYSRYLSYNATDSDYYYFRIYNGTNLNYTLQIVIIQKPEPSIIPTNLPPPAPPEPEPISPDNSINGFNLFLFLVLFLIGMVSTILFFRKNGGVN